MNTASGNPNTNTDNRSSSDGRKQSPPAFLDLADSVSCFNYQTRQALRRFEGGEVGF